MRYLFIIFIFSFLNVKSQVQVLNPQYFEWDTNIVQSIEAFNEGLTRIIASEQGVCVTTRKYKTPELNSMYKELHFFDNSMNYTTSVLHGETGNDVSFGGSEDIFALNDYLYVLDFQSLIYSLDSVIEFHCFSKYNFEGDLISTDTLWGREHYEFYNGDLSNPSTPMNYRYINGNYVYYISLRTNSSDSEKSLVRCNLNDASFSLIPFDLGLNGSLRTFLGVSDSSFLIEKRQPSGSLNQDFFEQYDLNGNSLNTVFIGEPSVSNSSVTLDYITENGTISIIYRANFVTDRKTIEFINDDLSIANSIDIHGNEYNTGRLMHSEGAQTFHLVLLPRYTNNYNYRLVEIDIPTQSIVFDTTFVIPFDDFSTLTSARSAYINQEQGNFIRYGVKLGSTNTPYFHRINVYERKAYFDSVSFIYNDIFQSVNYINVDYNNGIYYIVGHNPSTTDDELNAYCVGTLNIPTSIDQGLSNDLIFNLSPNPARDELFLTKLPTETLQIQIHDLQGRILFSKINQQLSTAQLPISDLNAGLYFVSVLGKQGLQTRKFIKN